MTTPYNRIMRNELTTEARNPHSENLDELSTEELVQLINREDAKVAAAVAEQTAQIAQAIDLVVDRMRSGGRLIYVGAGTSGRLGVLDAAECPPTFNADPEQVIGLIAGGHGALQHAVEGAEDSPEGGARDLEDVQNSARANRSRRQPAIVGVDRLAERSDVAEGRRRQGI